MEDCGGRYVSRRSRVCVLLLLFSGVPVGDKNVRVIISLFVISVGKLRALLLRSERGCMATCHNQTQIEGLLQ